jgi:hypothetical protein
MAPEAIPATRQMGALKNLANFISVIGPSWGTEKEYAYTLFSGTTNSTSK